MIGIIVAMEKEISDYLESLQKKGINITKEDDFYLFTLQHQSFVVTVSGVGKVNAAIAAVRLDTKYPLSSIINLGIAGAISHLDICQVVIGQFFVQSDFDTSPLGDPRGMIFPCQRIKFYPDADLSAKIKGDLESLGYQPLLAGVATGDSFIASGELAKEIEQLFGCRIVDMEVGALGYYFEKRIPFCSIKVVSDVIGIKGYQDNYLRALACLGQLTAQILEKLATLK